jgi:hypothetical protein
LNAMKECLNCSKPTKRNCYTYCSNRCQFDYQYRKYIEKWKAGLVSGNRGIKFPLLSNHLKRYLLEKFGEKCCLCDWNKRHPITNKVPLEANHIDGNPLNNKEENLQLICPNCHSLTSNFRNLNKGNGREYRRKKLEYSSK